MDKTSSHRPLGSVVLSVVLLIGLGVMIFNAFKSTGAPIVEMNRPAPNFTLAAMGGGDLQLSDFKGKVVLLNFWATWCEPCVREMPAMQAVYEEYRDKGFEILAVNLGQDEGTVRRFIESVGGKFPVVYDITGGVGDTYLVRNMPTSYFIDRNGVVRHQLEQEMTEERITELVLDLL